MRIYKKDTQTTPNTDAITAESTYEDLTHNDVASLSLAPEASTGGAEDQNFIEHHKCAAHEPASDGGAQRGHRRALKMRALAPVLTSHVCFHAGMCIVLYLPLHLRALGLTAVEMGVLNLVVRLASIAVRPAYAMLADKLGRHKLMICAGLLLFAVSLASFAVVPPRARVQNAEPAVQSAATLQISKLNTSDISTTVPVSRISEFSGSLPPITVDMGVVNGVTLSQSPQSSVIQSKSLSGSGLDSTLITTSVVYAAVIFSATSARGIIDSIVFAVALAAHVTGRRVCGLAQAAGALSAMVASIFYGFVLDRWQSTSDSTAARPQQLSSNGSVLVNVNVTVPVWNNRKNEAQSESETNSNYMCRFSIVIACGCVALLLNILSVCFYRTAPRKKQTSVLRDVWSAILSSRISSILLVIFVTGFLSSSYEGLFYWYIQDLGGSTFFVGLILALRKGADIVGSLIGPVIITRIGSKPAFLLVFAVHVLRLASLAALPYTAHIHLSLGPLGLVRPAYWALPLESLHAITFSLDRVLYSSELSAHSPASSISSLVAFGQSMQLGLGAGLLGLSQGTAYSTIGPQAFYALLSTVALSAGVLYAIFQYCVLRRWAHQQRSRETEELNDFAGISTRA